VRFTNLSIIGLAALSLASCTSVSELGLFARAERPDCSVGSDGELSLRGPTDEGFLGCVTAQLGDPGRRVTTIRLSSAGGDVRAALAAAEVIAQARPSIVIDGMCASSCANYLIPVAKDVTLLPGARILLHGSIDGHFLAAHPRATAAYEAQAEFVSRWGVPLGWLLYRDAQAEQGGFGIHVTGQESPMVAGQAQGRLILVEEAFFRSCLPHIPVKGFDGAAGEEAARNAALRAALVRQGVYRSGGMRCRERG
jgi:hypothetical protein